MSGKYNIFDWLRKKDPLLVENKEKFSDFSHNNPLRDYSFVVFDTELTELNRRRGEIVSIGAVRIKGLQIELNDTFYQHVKPKKMSHTEATLIHRITPEELKLAPEIEEVVPQFVKFLGRSLIVGHCINIDMDFLDSACRRLLGGPLRNPTIDTMRLARGYQRTLYGRYHDQGGKEGNYNLQDLTRKFQLPVFEAHNALEDAMQTAYLFLFLVKKIRTGGMETLKDLCQACQTGSWEGW